MHNYQTYSMKTKFVFLIYLLLFIIIPNISLATDIERIKPKKYNFILKVPLQFNSVGLKIESDINRKIKMFDSDNLLLNSNYMQIGYRTYLTPTEFANGPILKISPALIFDVEMFYGYILGWQELVYDSLNSPISFDDLNDKRAKDSKFGGGNSLDITANFRLKFSNIVLLDRFEYYYLNLDVGDIYYNYYRDHLQKDGSEISNDVVLGYMWNQKLLMGIDYANAFNFDDNFSTNLISLISVFNNPSLLSNNDTMVLKLGRWIDNKYRKEEFGGIYFLLFYSMKFEW